jgi:hypothetical protein
MSQTNGHAPKLEDLRDERQVWESFGPLYGPDAALAAYGTSPFRYDGFGRVWLPLTRQGPGATKDGRNEPFIQTDSDLDGMRALACWLTTKNDLAIGAVRTIRNLTIKQGYEWEAKPAPGREGDEKAVRLAAQVQRVIDKDADLNRLPQRERSSCTRAVRDGEVFVRHFRQDDGTTRHRFVRAEQVRDPGNYGPCASFGIETDEDRRRDGGGDAYHVTYDGTCFERVPAADVSFLKRNTDEEIKRGLSDFYSAGEVFDEVAKLLRGMRRGATLLSKIAWIEEFANATTSQIQAHAAGLRDANVPRVEHPFSGKQVETQFMADGTVVRTKDNKKYQPPPLAGNTTNFVSVVQACLRAVGVRWGFPEYFISGDASNNNYASILVSGSPLVNGIECEQDDFGQFFLRWRWVAIRNACAAGLIDAPFEEVERLVDVHFTAPQVAVANEAEAAQIDSQDMQAGVMSVAERRRRRSLDGGLMDREIAEEAKKKQAAQPPGGDAGAGGAPPGGGPAPAGAAEAPPGASPELLPESLRESLPVALREQYALVLELL